MESSPALKWRRIREAGRCKAVSAHNMSRGSPCKSITGGSLGVGRIILSRLNPSARIPPVQPLESPSVLRKGHERGDPFSLPLTRDVSLLLSGSDCRTKGKDQNQPRISNQRRKDHRGRVHHGGDKTTRTFPSLHPARTHMKNIPPSPAAVEAGECG